MYIDQQNEYIKLYKQLNDTNNLNIVQKNMMHNMQYTLCAKADIFYKYKLVIDGTILNN